MHVPSPNLARFAIIAPGVLVVAWFMGLGARRVLRRPQVASGATMTVISVLGVSLGYLVASLVLPNAQPWNVLALLIAFTTNLGVLLVVSAVIWRLTGPRQQPSIEEQARLGESDRLEFKSSARWNLRTNQRDEAMENVVAKTVAAFANTAGGTLLIGVDDDGNLLGLANDFSTLKSPDADRFELWLRDMLTARLDANTAALPAVDWTRNAAGDHVCRVQTPRSPRPVYLRPGKNAAPELWVRVGNSTRRLSLDDAVQYVTHHWPSPFAVNLRTRIVQRLQ